MNVLPEILVLDHQRDMLWVMPQFITRVELPRGTEEQYSKLHTAMASRGFSREITDQKGMVYFLPTAEYIREGDALKLQTVYEDAWAGASSVSSGIAVLVAEAAWPMMFRGLNLA